MLYLRRLFLHFHHLYQVVFFIGGNAFILFLLRCKYGYS
ncbi:putative membrane protein [Shigella flexneri K-227]|uniref:Putative membrane protein n=1 Tax=Shigella flexneri K-227 TaxID=766147 RepID=F5P2S0_SHIFL|nr:putative membrane protein [Shigella flexneri K-671]EGJ81543.1 putative membrane protein [Shigella flexneri 2747-71]EGK31773.1 putative membrane protein [Shigella flexneri K-304]EGK32547.1 putative membrane protein [Shigella flexneri K-227]EGM59427.1 putative membrane protein [Shigella flexneri SFJ17B]EIQ20180.1 putative membrane protein [Shigella flexneri K-404]EIQ55655.1 putative membrane protein [Shigella flexneri 1235-66]EJL10124.1 putative membrane protein [Shigella flexneri 6603-63]